MALTSTNASSAGSLFGGIGSVFSKIWDALIAISETNIKVRELEFLNSLSDEALASRGLRREDIVRHVFRSVL